MRGNVLIWYLRAHGSIEDRNGFCSLEEDNITQDVLIWYLRAHGSVEDKNG